MPEWEIFKNEQSPLYEVICWRDDKTYDVKHSGDDPDEAQAAFERLSGGAAEPKLDTEGKRFCGRCQTWRSEPMGELHFCVRAPRKIGYALYERDEPAIAKNEILTSGRKFKRGKLIATFPAEEE